LAKCFPIAVVRAVSRVRGGPWQEDEWAPLVFAPDAVEAFDDVLAPFDTDTDTWLAAEFVTRRRRELPPPVAVIAFQKEYRLAGHFVTIRTDRRALPFTTYSLRPGERPRYPLISLIYAFDWRELEATASKSPFLKGAWEALSQCDSRTRWLCIADPLPQDWVATVSVDDEAVYRNAT
jgi:hypothetical protein